jgi:hypothetical protein
MNSYYESKKQAVSKMNELKAQGKQVKLYEMEVPSVIVGHGYYVSRSYRVQEIFDLYASKPEQTKNTEGKS